MKIVSLLPSATEIVCALGLEAHLVGVTHSCDYPPQVRRLPKVTSTAIPRNATSREIDQAVRSARLESMPLYEIDVELMDRLRPDVIVTQGICDVCAICDTQALAVVPMLAVEPRVVNLAPHHLEDVLGDVRRIGRATGYDARARELIAAYRERIEAVKARVSGASERSVVVLEWVDPPFSCGHWTPEVVALAGGVELLALPGRRSRQLEWTEIQAADPDVMVLASCGQDIGRTMQDWDYLSAHPGFDALTCVRDKHVYIADGAMHFSRPSPRLIDSLELLAETLHPSGRPGAASLTRVDTLLQPG